MGFAVKNGIPAEERTRRILVQWQFDTGVARSLALSGDGNLAIWQNSNLAIRFGWNLASGGNMKLWQLNSSLDKKIEEFTVSDDYLLDMKLLKYDCIASIAHAKMLHKISFVKKRELSKLEKSLQKIIQMAKKGKFKIKQSDEDCHTAIENFLVKKCGNAGKKIHLGRSRNDQVLVAIRLYTMAELKEIEGLAKNFLSSIKKFKKKFGKIKMPGYTHMQKAMPSSIGLLCQSYIESMQDDLKCLGQAYSLNNQNPLGTTAGYGCNLNLDRKFTSKLLGFAKIQNNPIYCQNSRGKIELLTLCSLQQLMLTMNKIASDLMLFSTAEFGYFKLPAEFTTGSSIMPQKRNPDAIELLRAKTSSFAAFIFQINSIICNLPSGFNRDLQLTKKPLIGGIESCKNCLEISTMLFSGLQVNKTKCEAACTPEIYATEKAYGLVKAGMPFREAYLKIKKEMAKEDKKQKLKF